MKTTLFLTLFILTLTCQAQFGNKAQRVDPTQGTDFDGNPIIGVRDIGAYEYQPKYSNVPQTVTRTKNDCTGDSIGETMTVTIPAKIWWSDVSQYQADSAAIVELNANAQTFTNTNGKCIYQLPQLPVYYYNTEQTGIAYKDNCGENYRTDPVAYTVPAGSYSSTISQADADAKATFDLNNNKQAYANQVGVCTLIPITYWNTKQTFWATKQCPWGYRGSRVYYYVQAHTFSSMISVSDANAKARIYGNANKQAYANLNGTCIKK